MPGSGRAAHMFAKKYKYRRPSKADVNKTIDVDLMKINMTHIMDGDGPRCSPKSIVGMVPTHLSSHISSTSHRSFHQTSHRTSHPTSHQPLIEAFIKPHIELLIKPLIEPLIPNLTKPLIELLIKPFIESPIKPLVKPLIPRLIAITPQGDINWPLGTSTAF
ncbi:hypothetical protein LZ32DRAFT_57243 [Colletotrichum eremochloae]|nr:hypothetical protein LZ32DRAFT_57243 [Colletotrichum eremochloae]